MLYLLFIVIFILIINYILANQERKSRYNASKNSSPEIYTKLIIENPNTKLEDQISKLKQLIAISEYDPIKQTWNISKIDIAKLNLNEFFRENK